MGLDMYLWKAKRFGNATPREISLLNDYFDWKANGGEDTLEDWCGVREEDINHDLIKLYENEYNERGSLFKAVGYWRKANQIHNWFVQNVQNGSDDCWEYEVTKSQLEELLEKVKICLDTPTRADTLLPTTSGFFFGNTDYDYWYFEQLKDTIDILNQVLSETTLDNEMIIYSASW